MIIVLLLIQIVLLVICVMGFIGKLKKYKYENVISISVICLSLIITFFIFIS